MTADAAGALCSASAVVTATVQHALAPCKQSSQYRVATLRSTPAAADVFQCDRDTGNLSNPDRLGNSSENGSAAAQQVWHYGTCLLLHPADKTSCSCDLLPHCVVAEAMQQPHW